MCQNIYAARLSFRGLPCCNCDSRGYFWRKIISFGFGRTGTRSFKEAVDILGYGLTHHMEEIFINPDQVAHSQAVVLAKVSNGMIHLPAVQRKSTGRMPMSVATLRIILHRPR